MRRITAAFLYAIILIFSFQSCVSIDRLVESGDYDRAIQLAQKRLTGKERKNPKLVLAAEEAFAKVTARELREIDRLKGSRDEAAWGRINALYRNIRKRQDALRPLLPLTDKNGYTATFNFVDIDREEQESRRNAADYHYNEATRFLRLAERGDKPAARKAHKELEETQRYFRNYKDVVALQRRAHELGISHILVRVENDAPVILPVGFERRLREIDVSNLSSFWQQYHVEANPRVSYDFQMRLRITDIVVSPEAVRERQYTDTKEIEDGREYVLDSRGNVAKDSLGNDITVPRKVTIAAQVLEVFQQKEARVEGVLEVVNLQNNNIVNRQSLNAAAIFENYASTFQGDKRALSDESRRRIGNIPMPFPTNEVLVLQAADQLKPALLERITEGNRWVQL